MSPGPTAAQRKRVFKNRLFVSVCILTASLSIIALTVLLSSIVIQGYDHFSLRFLENPPSRKPDRAGLHPAILGSIWICSVCALTALPLGVGTAILLEEYKPKKSWLKTLHGLIQLNITNLAGVPSVVYGIIGLTAFAQMFGLMGNANNPAFSIGVRWCDMYLDEGGQALYVPVDAQDTPPTQPSIKLEFQDEDGRVVAVQVVDPQTIQPVRDEIHGVAQLFKDHLTQALAGVAGDDPSAVERVAVSALTGVGLQSSAQEAQQAVLIPLTQAKSLTGRAGRRAIRKAVAEVKKQETAHRLRGYLVADAQPSRIDIKSRFYVQFPFGRSVLAGGLTLMLVILPVVIVSAQESLRAVPDSIREAALAVGATKWQMVSGTTLPAAIPGIMTGAILAMSRAIGEAAPILVLGGIVYITFTPEHLMDDFTVMPLQIYEWVRRPQPEFRKLAASGIIVLLAILLTFNTAAIVIRQKFQKPLQ